jgi:phospholipid transport system substrate-binding protein
MRGIIYKFKLSVLLCGMIVLLGSCNPATQEVDKFFRYINDVRQDLKSNKSEAKKQKLLTKARKKLLSLIDTEYVGQLSLGSYFYEIPEAEKKEFLKIFHELLAYNLVKSYIPINTVADQNVNVEFIGEEVKLDQVFNLNANVIHIKLIGEKVTYLIDFYMHPVGKKYKLYDVYLDGASVLQDYRNQFYSIISTKGFPHLLDLLKEKYNQLEAGSVDLK